MIGLKIAEGREAEVYTWDGDAAVVLKLYRPGYSGHVAESAALRRLGGGVAPRLVDVLEIDGRHGLLLERLDGSDMLAMLQRYPWRLLVYATTLADAHIGIHSVPAPPDLPDARQALAARIDAASLRPQLHDFARRLLDQLPTGDRLCHGDFHPGYAEPDELAGGGWDVIIVATGGLPATPQIPGAEHVVDGWDILSGAKHVTGRVLVFDDHGGNQALDVTEAILRKSSRASADASPTELELVTPEQTVSPDVGGIVASGYLTALAESGVRISVLRLLRSVRRADDGGGPLVVTLGVEGSDWTEDREVDAVVVEAGTQPVTDVYDGLVPDSSNGGQIDLADLLARRPQTGVRNRDGTYQLFRIGDAVAGRNVHAAMLDAARLCQEI